ncbi:MAG TPA: trifunctional transcriptional regulator/proline dehydrogenase/L-glutamate gamma-semialdehyde dehydrogenase, partial [Burkholderiaceae bacterium]|nr:trifunctional transcriptional regulator/proline dehydrogenase/L-glutamate gamma-semialdehyde dehydrogenase [Burkholderiaceae bacterium]
LKRLQRNPEIKLGVHTIHQANLPPDTTQPSLLETLLAWANSHGHEHIAELGERYLHTSPIATTLVLPGPTGERNELSFAPRGTVLCAATRVDALLNQLIAVLATDNIPAIASTAARLIPSGLPAEVQSKIVLIDQLETAQLDFALVESACIAEIRPLLAKRDGAIIGVIETKAELPIPLWRLVAERATCVNTTAAGGNASLMTLGT